MPTRLSDLAKRLGLDQSTVSRALRDDPRVKAGTRSLIRKTAEELGYRPNLAARALAEGKSRTVWFVIPSLGQPVDREPAEKAGPRLLELGYDLLLAQHYGNLDVYRRVLGRIAAGGADGAVVIPHPASDGEAEAVLLQRGIPMVYLDRRVAGVPVPVVTTDNAAATALLLEYLIVASGRGEPSIGTVVIGFSPEANDVERSRAAAAEVTAARFALAVLRGTELRDSRDLPLSGLGAAYILASSERRVGEIRDLLGRGKGGAPTRIFAGTFDSWKGPTDGYGRVAVAVQDFAAMAERAVALIVDALEGRIDPRRPALAGSEAYELPLAELRTIL